MVGTITSGNHRGAAPRCEHRVVLDLAEVAVEPTVSWRCWYGDGRAATLTIHDNAVTIVYHRCDKSGRCIADIALEHAPFHFIPVYFGGKRRLLGCPGCGRRCRVLYAGAEHIRCRLCLRLRYLSEHMGQLDRAWKRATKIARRVDPKFQPGNIYEFPPRAKWMRKVAYQRLVAAHARQVERIRRFAALTCFELLPA